MKRLLFLGFFGVLVISSCSKKDDAATEAVAAAETAAGAKPLSASFFIEQQSDVKEGNVAQFRNTSVSAVSYKWDFGTGDISAEREPAYIFEGCGNKTVLLIAKDAAGHEVSSAIELNVLCKGKHAPSGH